MPRLLGNIPWIRRLFSRGARPDVRPEARQDGVYEWAVNMRQNSVTGNVASLESIGGERPRWRGPAQYQPIQDGYVCIGACQVQGNEVSFWAHINGDAAPDVFPPLVVVNGFVMVASPLIPYQHNRPLQFGDVSSCDGGIIYPVDDFSIPLFWDIPAIIAAFNSGSQQYFSQFSLDFVSVAQVVPAEWPEFTGLIALGDGMAPGQYQYWLRYVTVAGDRTNNGPPTPLISVPRKLAPVYGPIAPPGINPNTGFANQYPGGQTIGGIPNTDEQIPTQYAIALRFIVDNRPGYSFAEVVRRRFNDGQGINGAGIVEVVGRITLQGGLNDIVFVDPRDANFFEVVPNAIAEREQLAIRSAKGVEYADNRLVYANVRLKDLAADIRFREVGGQRMVPITQRVATWYGEWYNDGHADPVNGTYLKGFQHGERYSFGLQLWDGSSTRSPVIPIEDNKTMPWRRDRKRGDSFIFSSDPIYAANNECQGNDPVSPTFDAIVQGRMSKETTNAGGVGFINVMGTGLGAYNPWTPIGPFGADATRYRFSPVAFAAPDGSTQLPVSGHVWNPELHSLGQLFYGPENLQQAAPWAKVMSVVSTEPAGRVVAEGMLTYRLDDPGTGIINGSPSTGTRDKFSSSALCYFPDFADGTVPQSVIEDIQSNPQNYRLQLTPFGFYTEVYGYDSQFLSGLFILFDGNYTNGIDMLSFAGVQYDNGLDVQNPTLSVNVGEQPYTMGAQPAASAPPVPSNYVAPGRWRRLNSDPLNAGSDTSAANYSAFYDPSNTAQGAFLFPITNFFEAPEGRGTRWVVESNYNIYTVDGIAAAGSPFNSQPTRRFNEPFYVAKIIRDGATVPDLNVQRYRATGSYIVCAPEGRCIGIAPASAPGQETTYELFHARKDDCVGRFGTDYRYAYVQQPDGIEKRYVCVTNNTFVSANLPAIAAAIAANGFWQSPDDGLEVHGVYTYVNQFTDPGLLQEPHPKDYIRFGTYPDLPVPQEGSRISIKWDPRAPWRVFGGDRSIGPCIFAPYDRYYQRDSTANTAVRTAAPLPYSAYERSSGYIMPFSGNTANPTFTINGLSSIRQWCVMWYGLTKAQKWMDIGSVTEPEKFPFPRTHYVIRPYASGSNSSLNPQYWIDYPSEDQFFGLGGFRFWTETNNDYSKKPLITYLGVPRNGEEQNLDLCTSLVASERVNPLATDSPGNRTFYFDNIFPISEENGEIKTINVLDQGGRQSLWALCERGLAYIPYNKAMLTDAEGNLIATQSTTQFWPRLGGEQWIARGERGSPDQLWRFSLKAHSAQGAGDADTLYWADRSGVYRLVGGQIKDIARGKNMSILLPLLQGAPTDYSGRYSSGYNYRNDEPWFSIDGSLYVYNPVLDEWTGSFTYSYDQYLSFAGNMIGYRTLQAVNLDAGLNLIGGEPVPCEVTTAYFPSVGSYKEAMRFRIVGSKPDFVEVLDADKNFLCRMEEATGGVYWVKLYDGWEGWVSRVDATVDPQRRLPQSMGFYIRCGWVTLGPKQITAMDSQIKSLL